MPIADLVLAAGILFGGALLQTAIGFGLGLVCIPLLVWSGLELPEAVAMVLGAGAVQTGYGTFVVRQHVRWRRVAAIAAFQWMAVPFGVLAMTVLVGWGEDAVKQVIGVALLALLTLRVALRPRPREVVPVVWGYTAGASGGFLAGLVGMGGPPLVLFALAHDWNKERYRAFLWPQFMSTAPIALSMLTWQFGLPLLSRFAVGIALFPFVWVGARGGLALTEHWDARRIQLAAIVFLYAVALVSALAPYLAR